MEFGRNGHQKEKEEKPVCKYGSECYRTNPSHLAEFAHPERETQLSKVDQETQVPTAGRVTQLPKPDRATQVPKTKPETSSSKDVKVKRKITDFFGKASSSSTSGTPKRIKPLTSRYEEESDYSIEDDVTDSLSTADLEKHLANASKKTQRSSDESSSSTGSRQSSTASKSNTGPPSNAKELGEIMAAVSVQETVNKPFKPLTNSDISKLNVVIKKLFLVEMPLDFFQFWNFCIMVKKREPKNVLLRWLDLRLIGPYDVLDGTLSENVLEAGDSETQEKLLCHWRFYYDVPEFQSVLKKNGTSELHFGYFRDDPKEPPAFVGSNDSRTSCTITPIGTNIFTVVSHEIDKQLRKTHDDEKLTTQLKALQRRLKEFCKDHHVAIKDVTVSSRNSVAVCKTFHGAGLVVPVENDIGYRPLPMNYAALKKLLKKIMDCDVDRDKCSAARELQEMFTLVNYANDECDFGMGLELGINLFCQGDDYFHKYISFLSNTGYQLVQREEFAAILRAHLKSRRKGPDLDFRSIKNLN